MTPGCAASYENSSLHFSSVIAQWQSVWQRNRRSSVRITGKPMVLKVRRKIRSWSCDQCHVWSVVLGVGWKIGVKRRLTRYLICKRRSFSVDSCVRKHAKVYGENRQQCFNFKDRSDGLLPNLSQSGTRYQTTTRRAVVPVVWTSPRV